MASGLPGTMYYDANTGTAQQTNTGYSGNNDFRGYLKYQAEQGNSDAALALNFTGNDGGIDRAKAAEYMSGPVGSNAGSVDRIANWVGQQYGSWSGAGSGYNTYTGADNTSSYEQQQAANQQRLRESVNSGKANVFTGANEQADAYNRNTQNSILDWISNLEASQRGVNNQRVNAQMGRDTGYQGILDMVGRGMRSAGVMFANRNAGDSSATDAAGRAYGDLGQRNAVSLENQFAVENRNIDETQRQVNDAKTSGRRKFATDIQNEIDSIVSGARNSFAALNDQLVGAGLADRIAIEQEKEAIRSQVLQKLAGLDSQVNQVDSRVMANTQDQNITQAGELRRAGQGAGSQFNIGSATGQFQQGANPSQLPLYSYRRNNRTA